MTGLFGGRAVTSSTSHASMEIIPFQILVQGAWRPWWCSFGAGHFPGPGTHQQIYIRPAHLDSMLIGCNGGISNPHVHIGHIGATHEGWEYGAPQMSHWNPCTGFILNHTCDIPFVAASPKSRVG